MFVHNLCEEELIANRYGKVHYKIAPGRVRAGEDDRSTGQTIVTTTHDGQLTIEQLIILGLYVGGYVKMRGF